MSRRSPRAWLVALAYVLCAGCSEAPQRELRPAPPLAARAPEQALRAAREQGSVRVVVLLATDHAPVRDATRPGQRARLERVLEQGGGAFRIHGERSVGSAWTLTVDARSLEALVDSELVRGVALDHGGHAHLTQALPLAGFGPVQTAGLDGTGVTVAVLDTGIDATHPDLAGRIVDEACFCSNNCCPDGSAEQHGPGSAVDDNGHGTHVAGEIASSGESASPRGGAPGVSLVAVKVLDQSLGFCCTSDLIAALTWVLEQHPEVRVVNMSLGTSALFEGDCDAADATTAALAQAIAEVEANGTLVVASSGNQGASTAMAAPACIAAAVSTGAVWDEDIGAESIYCSEPMTSPDRIACFSNASATTDVLAPGGRIDSTWLLSSWRARVGTSNAAPLVSACAASLLEAAGTASPLELRSALRTSSTWLHDARNDLSYPRLDCAAALEALVPSDAGAESDAGAASDASMPADASTWADADTPSDASVSDDAASDAEVLLDAASADAAALDAGFEPVDASVGIDDAGGGGGESVSDAGRSDIPEHDAALDAAASEDASLVPALDAALDSGMRGGPALPGATQADAGCSCRAAGSSRGSDPPWHIAPLFGLIVAWRLTRRRRA